MSEEKNIKVKKPLWKRWWVWAIVIVIVIAAASSGNDEKAGEVIGRQDQQDQEVLEGSAQPEPEKSPEPELEPEPEPEPTWQEVKTWSGNGIKSTETFSIASKEWRIGWNATNENVAGILQIYVYKADGNLVTLASNQQGEGSDVSYVREGPGEFYLEINAANLDWVVTVEDKR